MEKLNEFDKLKRWWYMEMFFEFAGMAGFFLTYFTHGATNDLIFYGVIFFWSKADAGRLYKKMMALVATEEPPINT